jgi:broad specificity phosphatase PhoE
MQGRSDAIKCAKFFHMHPFEKVFCSDLRRCKETLEPFLPHLQTQEILYTQALREKSWGCYEGMSFEEIEASGLKYQNFLQWIDALGGESITSFYARVQNFFTNEVLEKNYEDVLVVTHSGVIKTFVAWQKQISFEKAFSEALSYGDYLVFDTKMQSFSEGKYNFG